MNVHVFVEGPSDRDALTALLRPLIERKQQLGIAVTMYPRTRGDRKAVLVTQTPVEAVNILLNNPTAVVVIMPDLYPKNKGFPHDTAEELIGGIYEKFRKALKSKIGGDRPEIESRFRAFCLKYDLEVLLLAAADQLRVLLNAPAMAVSWRRPVEDQNHQRPPKLVIEEIFSDYKLRYEPARYAALILGRADYRHIAEQCPQCFKPFVDFLEGLGPAASVSV